MDKEKAVLSPNNTQFAGERKISPDFSIVPSEKWSALEKTKARKGIASVKAVKKSAKSSGYFKRVSKSPPRMEINPKHSEKIGIGRGLRNNLDSRPNQATQSRLSLSAPETNVGVMSIRDRILTNAQETLLKMIEDGESETVIAKQVDVVEKLRARTKHTETSTITAGTSTGSRSQVEKRNGDGLPLETIGNRARRDAGLFINSSSEPELEPHNISSDSEIVCISDPPVEKGRKHRIISSKRIRKNANSTFEDATRRMAFPVQKPMSLPYGARLKKRLSPNSISKRSTVHSSFDETKTNRLDRHARKFNTTNADAKGKGIAVRTLENRIGPGALSDSDKDMPQSRGNGSSVANREKVDLQTLPDAPIDDLFEDFDAMDEEQDLLSDN